MRFNIALTGNPNVGKTSLYNRITGSFEHVGNWHGVTVKEVDKDVRYEGETAKITDLPGFYSMTVYSFEEAVSRDAVLRGENDVIVNVCEVSNLSRNLYLTLQLLELQAPMVLVVNMMDELKKQKKTFHSERIAKELGVEVVPMSAKYRTDVNALMAAAKRRAQGTERGCAKLPYLDNLPLEQVRTIIAPNLKTSGLNARWACIKVLEKDSYVLEKLDLNEAQAKKLSALGDWQARVAQYRYEYIDSLTEGAIVYADGEKKRKEKIFGFSQLDKIVLNKFLALPLFFLLMAAIFFVTFGLLGKYLSSLLELFFDNCLNRPLTISMTNMGMPEWIVALVGEGIIGGVGGILVFLPQVVLLFFFLALLEDSGYISRVAFMTDGIFRKIGLSGRSVFTMLMGFGCSATAVLTARGLEDRKMRIKTVLLTPFMSCSARLPVYAAIAGAFFSNSQPLIVFALYVLGACIAILIAAVFEKFIKPLKSGKLSFIMEMPPYRFPTAERVFQIILNNAKVFLIRVGTVVFAFNVIIWTLSNFSLTQGYVGTSGGSILQSLSSVAAPLFAPLGFGNWRAVTALLSGIVAKEVVISSIESMGGVAAIFVGPYAASAAAAFMVFTLLYVPCIATLGAIRKEIGSKWMVFSFLLQMCVAYFAAWITFLLGMLFTLFSAARWITALIAGGAIVLFAVVKLIVRHGDTCANGCNGCMKCGGKR